MAWPKARRVLAGLLVTVILGLGSGQAAAFAGVVVRELLDRGVYATIRHGRVISLECHPQIADGSKYLASEQDWNRYKNLRAAAIPFEKLNAETQRDVLLRLFKNDYVDERGWTHVVTYDGTQGLETIWSLCEWLTGRGSTYRHLDIPDDYPVKGQRVLVPAQYLREAMRRPTPRLAVPPDTEEMNGEDSELGDPDLKYEVDSKGPYAIYTMRQGDALYTSVVVRFTDFRYNDDILEASELIRQRSGIRDVRNIKAGQKVRIPLELLSARYLPAGSAGRAEYERTLQEARRLKGEQGRTRDLEGVVVILDPGHGGRDHGTGCSTLKLYEDELNYDIACRIRKILLDQTEARVHMTLIDRSDGWNPSDRSVFTHDTDEQLMTTPPHRTLDGNKVSLNLRWMLANSIFDQEVKNGVDPRKVVFTSIHCDWLFNETLRGAMVYIPGAQHRRDLEEPRGSQYAQYAEGRQYGRFTSTASERRRDEALSRNFAEALLEAMGKHDPPLKRHSKSDPIRSQIRRSRHSVYVPVVLRNNTVPTKILVEAANLANPTDRRHLANPKWRQWFAQAYVNALKEYFGS